MANAALWSHFPLGDRFVQPPPPTRAALESRGLLVNNGTSVPPGKLFYYFYAGDYDSSAWLAGQLWGHWSESARGSVPIGWAVDPGLAERFGAIFPLLFESLAPRDVIITGDSGAGEASCATFIRFSLLRHCPTTYSDTSTSGSLCL